MSNERHLKETIQRQADKIKELEANLQDYSVKWDLKNKQLNAQLDEAFDETKKLNKILYYFDTKLKNNAEYQELKASLIGGKEEQINFECLAVDSDCKKQCNECKIYTK
jgi:hypothetical protein